MILSCVVFTGVTLLATGCAAHRPTAINWRFVSQGTSQILVPPGISSSEAGAATVSVPAAQRKHCPATIPIRKNRAIVKIDRASLTERPQGWLSLWASDLEAQGCIAPTQAMTLASRLTESLPLDAAVAFRVLYPNELMPPQRIQIVSPILRDPSGPVLATTDVNESSTGLNLTVRSSDNLIGYETTLYAVQSRPTGSGYALTALYADRTINGTVNRVAQPSLNYLTFPANAAYFRLYVKSDQTAFTALVLAAATRLDLDRDSQALVTSDTSCDDLPRGHCVAIPRRVALNALVPVMANNKEVLVRWSADLGEALRTAGARQPDKLLASLSILKPYRGRLTPIEFDHTSSAILRLPITGNEQLSWSEPQ